MSNPFNPRSDFFNWLIPLAIEKPNYPDIRPYLAHYTSAEAAIAILNNQSILMGNTHLLNDPDEMYFVLNEALTQIFSNVPIKNACFFNTHDSLIQAFSEYVQQFHRTQVMESFVFSCCRHNRDEKDGKLSMWRGYGGNGKGAALIFDTTKIKPTRPEYIIARVAYKTREERKHTIQQILNRFAELLTIQPLALPQLQQAAYHLYLVFKQYATLTKHPAFKEESEWRVVYRTEWDQSSSKEDKFEPLLRNGLFEPRHRLDLNVIQDANNRGIPLRDLIHRIILGPSNSSQFAIDTFKKMLVKIGHNELQLKVVGSQIPYRSV